MLSTVVRNHSRQLFVLKHPVVARDFSTFSRTCCTINIKMYHCTCERACVPTPTCNSITNLIGHLEAFLEQSTSNKPAHPRQIYNRTVLRSSFRRCWPKALSTCQINTCWVLSAERCKQNCPYMEPSCLAFSGAATRRLLPKRVRESRMNQQQWIRTEMWLFISCPVTNLSPLGVEVSNPFEDSMLFLNLVVCEASRQSIQCACFAHIVTLPIHAYIGPYNLPNKRTIANHFHSGHGRSDDDCVNGTSKIGTCTS